MTRVLDGNSSVCDPFVARTGNATSRNRTPKTKTTRLYRSRFIYRVIDYRKDSGTGKSMNGG